MKKIEWKLPFVDGQQNSVDENDITLSKRCRGKTEKLLAKMK